MKIAWVCALALAGCALGDEYRCTSSAQCGSGRCEPSGDCSFPDGMCPSGYRYGQWSRKDLAGTCAAPATGDCTGLLLCDGFDGAISSAWLQQQQGGKLSIESDPAHVHRGSGSLKVHVDPGMFASVSLAKHDPPIPQNLVYARLWILVPQQLSGQFLNPPRIVGMNQSTAGYGGAAAQIEDTAAPSVATSSPVQAGPNMIATARLALGQWQCLELQLRARTDGGSDGFVQVLLGDATAARVSPLNVMPDQPLDELEIGVGGQLAGSTPFELWIDEVAVSNQPIGCAR